MNELERELQETEDHIALYENELAVLDEDDTEREKVLNERISILRSYADRLEKRLYGFEPDYRE